ncbi:glycosyltransferase family 2 protein [Cochlodiniinecator piscidefendens]|uniref:glycosyltransferase family 2 protein n=1 Tax=Cochlodiniinecator piscidefendens TaxID=2715756 RepID=UPI0014092C8E|nr:glycosyltransferase [Cochlodiniinecator piscidefendens]
MSPTVSVIVVSRGRPASLKRTLLGVSQLWYRSFEIIVVADQAGCNAVRGLPMAEHICVNLFEDANISAARNQGLAKAAGDIVAFIDDDAVPEPNWLTEIVAPFKEGQVAAVGGYVIGRNGFSFQWQGRSVDGSGQTKALAVNTLPFEVFEADSAKATKTEGTNCAFRREMLLALGGFDPAYRFYNDETDLNMRIALAGYATAICPKALVHHGYEASACRRADRVPKSLFEIGASIAVFLRKFAPASEISELIARERLEQHKRLERFLISGQLPLGQLSTLLQSFDRGVADGNQRLIAPLLPVVSSHRQFDAFPSQPPRVEVMSGRIWQIKKLKQRAAEQVSQGKNVRLYVFSYTCLFHRRVYTASGYWLQVGGVFGRSRRTDPLIRKYTFNSRLKEEIRWAECPPSAN